MSLVTSVGAAAGRAEYFEDATDDSAGPIEWAMPESRYVDAAALLVLTTASLRAGQALHPTGTWEPRRFRPDVLVDSPDVTREQSGLEPDRDVFRTLARHHGGRFGAWCDVLVPGVVALGQEAMVGS